MEGFNTLEPNRANVLAVLEYCVGRWKYRPLPKLVSVEARAFYAKVLNGFEQPEKRALTLRNCKTLIASDYDRVVIGDYGAYVEFSEEHLLQELQVRKGQEWRLDQQYLDSRGLNIKYLWLECNGVKVYKQVATVKYADYLAGKFYISVLDFTEESVK